MAQSLKFVTFDENLCRLCNNTTNTNQPTIAALDKRFCKVRVQEDDCFPEHLCRNCYRTLLDLRHKLLAFQTRCATTQINLGIGGEKVKRSQSSSKSNPFTLPCVAQRQRKSRILTQNSSRKAFTYSMMKKKSYVPLKLQVTKSGRLIKNQTALFSLIKVI